MSILIKGMEMPKPGQIVLVEIDENGDVFAAYDGGRTKLSQYRAVPVPKHGDLIDKGAICNECRRIAEEYDGIYPDCTYCPVHHSPTIIPADHIGEANEMVADKEGEG